MKSFAKKNAHQMGFSFTALGILLAIAQPATAATFSVGGYSWDVANSVTTGKIIQGQEQTSAYGASFGPNDPSVNNRTIGRLIESNTAPNNSYSFTLGKDNQTESIIELGWGKGMSLANQDGNDVVIYESGGSGEPEAYAVAVKKVGSSGFTNYLYQFSSGYWDSYSFATAIDFSNFGLNKGEQIEAIRIKNLISSDMVQGQDGQGFLGGQYQPKVGPNGLEPDYSIGKFDADITFVAGLHAPRAVPEPTSGLVLLVFGVAGANLMAKGKKSR
ncbi:MAG TPA: hypothetical protein V6D28_14325 [Leptolyngbyaceae cyanobacterium]